MEQIENTGPTLQEGPTETVRTPTGKSGNRTVDGRVALIPALVGLIAILWLLSHTDSKRPRPSDDNLSEIKRFMSQYEGRFNEPMSEHEKSNRAIQMMLEGDEEE